VTYCKRNNVPARGADEGTDKHLSGLRERNQCWREPLGLEVQRGEAVVAVHDGMNSVVHCHKVDATARTGGVGVPAEQQHGGVVVPVQEHQRLLAKNDEDRVDQLEKLREVHEHDPSAHRSVRPGEFFGGANGLLKRLR